MVVGKVYNLMFHVSEGFADEISVVCIGESAEGNPVYITCGKGYHRHVIKDDTNIAEDAWAGFSESKEKAVVFEGNDTMRIQRVFLDRVDHAEEKRYVLSAKRILDMRDYAAECTLPFYIKPL